MIGSANSLRSSTELSPRFTVVVQRRCEPLSQTYTLKIAELQRGKRQPAGPLEGVHMETLAASKDRITALDVVDIFERRGPVMPRSELRSLIEGIVASVFGVDPSQLRRPTRGQARIALARQVAMYIAHVGYGLTLTEVGELFQRDHTTVAHACQVVEQRRDLVDFDETIVLLDLIVRALSGVQRLQAAEDG